MTGPSMTIVGGEERARRAREVLAAMSERDGHYETAETLRSDDPLTVEDGGKTVIDAMLTFAAEASGIGVLREAAAGLLPYTSHNIGCAIYQRSWSASEPNCTCGLDNARAALSQSALRLAASISSREAE